MLDKVTVNKNELLNIVKKNYNDHKKIVEEAREGYLKEAEKALLTRLKKIRHGKVTELNFNIQRPIDHSKAYETTIRMLELSIENEVELTQQQFSQFVMDDWSWSHTFFATNVRYSTACSGMAVEKGYDL